MGPIPALILTMGVLYAAAFLVLRGVGWLERRARQRLNHVIEVNTSGVFRTLGETRESVTWASLRSVTILTTDEGPFVGDVWWLLEDESGGVAVPGGAAEITAIMQHLEQMPGYDPEAVVQAMGSVENARFTVWERLN
jgi:hypothetical protein